MERKDFKNWVTETEWKEVLWQHNTGKGYQHKQDMVSVFLWSYLEIERKFIIYFNEFGIIPNDVFKDMIFKFRQSFPKHGRIEGISYFDDLIELLIDKYKPKKDEAEKPALKGFQSNLNEGQIQTLFDLLKGGYIDISTNPGHFKAIFKNESLPAGFIPVKRVKKFTNTLLAYFVYELFQKENQSDYWHIAVNCFKNSKYLKQSLKNAYDYNPDRKPKGYLEIDTILKTIYSPLQ